MSGPLDHSNHYVIRNIETTQIHAVSFSPPFNHVVIHRDIVDGEPIKFHSIYFEPATYKWKTDPGEEPGSVLCNLMIPLLSH